jgi:hypothetical protein
MENITKRTQCRMESAEHQETLAIKIRALLIEDNPTIAEAKYALEKVKRQIDYIPRFCTLDTVVTAVQRCYESHEFE